MITGYIDAFYLLYMALGLWYINDKVYPF